MATFVIGDLQGCYRALQLLLEQINYRPKEDTLWFTGDIVNRGLESLNTLRFVKEACERDGAVTVLGNHDLHLLAVAYGTQNIKPQDTFSDILNAPDRDELCHWLRKQPLFYHDKLLGFALVHAGLVPQWDDTLAQLYASEIENVLRGDKYTDFFSHMYGDQPNHWHDSLKSWERLRFITNVFTRIRYCDVDGRMNLKNKGPIGTQDKGLIPWFSVPHRKSKKIKIAFGHWASLYDDWGNLREPNIYPLDSGCIWGNRLTAMRLDDLKLFQITTEKQKD